MATYQVTPPDQLDFTTPEQWPGWIRRFDRFRLASELSNKDGELQVNSLIYHMGDIAEDIFTSFGLSNEDAKVYDTVKNKFQQHFVAKRNTIFERAQFNIRCQKEGEPVETFILALHSLSEYCDYGALREDMIRDRIVVGILDSKLSEKMQLDPDLNLKKATDLVRQSEQVRKQQNIIRPKDEKPVEHVEAVVSRKGGHKPASGTPQKQYKQTYPPQCYWCGSKPSHPRSKCPAQTAICSKCSTTGHFAQVCKKSRFGNTTQANLHEIDCSGQAEAKHEEYAFLGSVTSQDNKPWTTELSLNSNKITFKLDSGADETAIPLSVFKHMNTDDIELQTPDKILRGAGGNTLPITGKFQCTLSSPKHRQTSETVYVVDNLHMPLLSRAAIARLQLLTLNIDSIVSIDTAKSQYPQLYDGLGVIRIGDPYDIKLEDNARPHAIHTPRRIPIPLLPKVKEELERMCELGIIEPVEQPTDWCACMVVVPKKDSPAVRICVDLTKLNQSVRREKLQLPTVEETLAQLAGAKIFTKLDATSSFWQIPLTESSALLTTFITPYGRFCFKRLPFGISSASEHFQRRISHILSNLPGVLSHIDDILVFGSSQQEHDDRLHAVLKRLQEAGLTLNHKCEFSKTEVGFLGHVINAEGIKSDSKKTQAIQDLEEPSNVSDVRRILGMANQLGKFCPNLAEITKPLRDLLSTKYDWNWGISQRQAFQQLKNILCDTPVLGLYDPSRETVVTADASSYGIGAALLQKQPSGVYSPIAYASRALSPTEQRYAQIEKEALASTWACERFNIYVLGMRFHLETDHKPLVPLLSSKSLDELPPRIQRFKMRLMKYDYTISHVPGKQLSTADALSRAPINTKDDSNLLPETSIYVDSVWSSLPASEGKLQSIKNNQDHDPILRCIKTYCQTQWPAREELLSPTRIYFAERGNLTVVNGLLLNGTRIVIPSNMRLEILALLHEGHQGISKTRALARRSVWWPGCSKQIEDLVVSCTTCARLKTVRAEPLMPTELPERPWQMVGTDLFQLKKSTYLAVIDYFSRYIEVAKISKYDSPEIIEKLKSIFARHGIPDIVRSDNGPQYSSEAFATFANEYGFLHITSSPHFPKSNGEAEASVKTLKSILMKCEDPYRGLLLYRTTPTANGYSPSQLLMGRQLKSMLPVHPNELKPKLPNFDEVLQKEKYAKLQQKSSHDRAHRVVELPALDPGDTVYVRDQKVKGVVSRKDESPRSYVVSTPTSIVRRNRVHLSLEPQTSLPESPITMNTECSQTPEASNQAGRPDHSDVPRTPQPREMRPRRERARPPRLIENC